jgi:phosphoribosylformimino-5-aminoimidazole carboxamide ribotide isomerase
MTIYPAIDLKGGRCVRLRQGDPSQETVFSDDPVAMARHWVSEGAEWLHVVDLDGAFAGDRKNAHVISEIVRSVSIPVEVGGGLRSMDQIRSAFASGVRRAVIGTAAVENPHLVREACKEFPEHIAVGIDARDGFVATRGWKALTEVTARDLALEMESLGVSVIIYTDIGRDGMLSGPNVEATKALAESIKIPVIASGGISSLNDIAALCRIASAGVEGVIVGRALYERKFTLAEAIDVGRRGRAR